MTTYISECGKAHGIHEDVVRLNHHRPHAHHTHAGLAYEATSLKNRDNNGSGTAALSS